jgi:hypothetical protein
MQIEAVEYSNNAERAEALKVDGTVMIDGLAIRACTGYPEQPGCGSPFVREFGKCGYMHWNLCPACAKCGCAELKTRNAQRAARKLERCVRRLARTQVV